MKIRMNAGKSSDHADFLRLRSFTYCRILTDACT
nr:MAG TPA: hypothetical protein [Caudoviricetes sp.]